MAELDSEFGNFSSAFPPASNPGGADVSLEIENLGKPILESGEKVDFSAAFPLGETCPMVFDPPDPDGTLPFDVLATCPVDIFSSEGGNAGGLTDFSQFNIADIPIPDLSDFNLEKGIFEIPPLPEELIPEAEADEQSKTSLFQGGQVGTTATHPGLGLPSLHQGPQSSATTFANHTNGSFHAFSLSGNTDSNAGTGILANVPVPTAATSSRNGPISHKSSWPQSAPTDIRTTQSSTGVVVVAASAGSDCKQDSAAPDNDDDEDVFGDFETSFEQRLPAGSSRGVTLAAAMTTTRGVPADSHSTPVEPVPSLRTSESHNGNSKLGSQRSEECTNFGRFDATASGSSSQKDVSSAAFSSQEPQTRPESQGDSFMTSKTDSNPHNGGTTAFTSVEEQSQMSSLGGDVNLGQPGISSSSVVKADVGGDAFFGAFQESTSMKNDSQTEFGSFATGDGNGDSRVGVRNAQSGGEFSGFQAFTSNTSCEDKPDEFGDFGNFQSPAGVDFASSNTSKDAGFGEFGTFQKSTIDVQAREFGDFGAFHSDTSGKVTAQLPTGSDGAAREPVASTPTASANTRGSAVKLTSDVLTVCFPSRGGSDLYPQTTRSRLTSHLLTSSDQQSSTWQSLLRCIDFTVPLYKWDKSYVQEHYQSALKIDPMLVSGPGVLPLFLAGPFDIPLGGQSAVEDLMESFGFEAELGPAQVPHLPSGSRAKEEERSAPALLDLSLPSTPAADVQKDPFSEGLAADLLGLDFSGPQQQQSQQLTSIQELLLNERLVVNRSTWMDSKLLEYESAATPPSAESSNTPTPVLLRKQSSINVEQQLLQLGLDASKTTFSAVPAQQTELSFSARTVLGRLPDLSFMLSDTVQST